MVGKVFGPQVIEVDQLVVIAGQVGGNGNPKDVFRAKSSRVNGLGERHGVDVFLRDLGKVGLLLETGRILRPAMREGLEGGGAKVLELDGLEPRSVLQGGYPADRV